MKIIITVSTYYPLTDGVQAVTQYHAEGLVKLGHEVIVVTTRYSGLKERESYNGVSIVRCDIQTKHTIHTGSKREYREQVLKLAQNANIIINVATQTATTETLYPILNKIKAKKILYMHGMYDFKWRRFNFKYMYHKVWNDIRWGFDYLISTKYLKQYDEIIQLHNFDRATVFFKKHYGITSNIVENAADNQFFDSVSHKTRKYILSVSNYSSQKNQAMLLKAFYKSGTENYDLVLIGSRKNSYFEYLLKLNMRLEKIYGKKNVEILANVPRTKIYTFVKEASIYLMGSKGEVFPISIVEAMASGIPFISTDVGIVKFLPGGVIVNTLDEMIYWLNLFIKNPYVARNIGRSGRQYAQKNLSVSSKVTILNNILER